MYLSVVLTPNISEITHPPTPTLEAEQAEAQKAHDLGSKLLSLELLSPLASELAEPPSSDEFPEPPSPSSILGIPSEQEMQIEIFKDRWLYRDIDDARAMGLSLEDQQLSFEIDLRDVFISLNKESEEDLQKACQRLDFLIEIGCNLHAKDHTNSMLYDYALDSPSGMPFVLQLVKRGLYPANAIHCACQDNNLALVKALVQNDPSLLTSKNSSRSQDPKSAQNLTPLMGLIGTKSNRRPVIDYLLSFEAVRKDVLSWDVRSYQDWAWRLPEELPLPASDAIRQELSLHTLLLANEIEDTRSNRQVNEGHYGEKFAHKIACSLEKQHSWKRGVAHPEDIIDAFRKSSEYRPSGEALLEDYHQGKPVVIQTGFKGHAIVIVLYKGYIAINNRGAGGFGEPSTSVFKVDSSRLFPETLDNWIETLPIVGGKLAAPCFYQTVPAEVSATRKAEKDALCELLEEALGLPRQISSNCSLASNEAALLSTLALVRYVDAASPPKPEEIEELKKAVAEVTLHMQFAELEIYLNATQKVEPSKEEKKYVDRALYKMSRSLKKESIDLKEFPLSRKKLEQFHPTAFSILRAAIDSLASAAVTALTPLLPNSKSFDEEFIPYYSRLPAP